MPITRRSHGRLPVRYALAVLLVTLSGARAEQIDIQGPTGSYQFGTAVAVLPNGNIVITDPYATIGAVDSAGAVYLLSPDGSLISTLTGSTPGDHVGSGGITVLPNGNVVVLSPDWNNSGATSAGSATWINGTTGLNDVVSAANSLVGSSTHDRVGYGGVRIVGDGNYVVHSADWSKGAAKSVGAVTWGSGATGIAGIVTSDNSLVGSTAYDDVGDRYVVALTNGNYVVVSPDWANGANASAGAITLASGATGMTGVVSTENSLVGIKANDSIGFSSVTALTNGNYVIASPEWSNGTAQRVGAVTWRDGTAPTSGNVSELNSLVGTQVNDNVGIGVGNSIDIGVVALTNGNYVVRSSNWNNGDVQGAGAVTWCNGAQATVGAVSASNSLVGTSAGDHIGYNGVAALTNGNYVVASQYWTRAGDAFAGAATWGNGMTGVSGPVSESNSLVGTAGDLVGYGGAFALANGNFVVASYNWNGTRGAVTWGDGSSGIIGDVSIANSFTGSTNSDHIGQWMTALANGNYVFASPYSAGSMGGTTWANGSRAFTGQVSATNSLTGRKVADMVGNGGSVAFGDGAFAVISSLYYSALDCTGAVTIASGTFRLVGTPQPYNSVFCGVSQYSNAIGYDASRKRFAIGRPGANVVSLLALDELFAESFD